MDQSELPERMSDLPPPAPNLWRQILDVLVRSLLKILGTALVTRGLVDQGTVDGLLPTISEELVGALLVGAGGACSVLHAVVTHGRWARAWADLRGSGATPSPTEK